VAHDPTLDGAGRALFSLVRFWARRWIVGGSNAQGRAIQEVLAVEAVAAVSRRGIGAVSITDVAQEIGVDQSNASRLVAQAVAAGVLAKARSAEDGRTATLSVTGQGEKVLAASWAHQEATFCQLVKGWAPEDQARFANYLRALAAQTPSSRQP
jgi:DNA-binding MarR family transcriptional regulator